MGFIAGLVIGLIAGAIGYRMYSAKIIADLKAALAPKV